MNNSTFISFNYSSFNSNSRLRFYKIFYLVTEVDYIHDIFKGMNEKCGISLNFYGREKKLSKFLKERFSIRKKGNWNILYVRKNDKVLSERQKK